jgi:MFS family permease
MMVFAMVLTAYSTLLTSISSSFSLSLAQSGIIFTANFIGFVIFILAGGVLADRIGKKTILSISLTGFAISLLCFPLSSNFYAALIIMFFIGGFG